MMKYVGTLMFLSVLLTACGPDLKGLKPDNPLPEDGTLKLALPDITRQQNRGEAVNQAQQNQPQQAQQQVAPTQPPPPTPELTEESADFPQKVDIPDATKATINTSKGAIVVNLYPNEAPKTVKNYADKSKSGFYDGLTFHRVEDWVIQGGDPQGTGSGGGSMPTELNDKPFKEGSLGVARGGDIKVSNDAQFFICKTDCSWLSGQYTNFGEVTEGLEVVKSITIGDTIDSVVVE